MKPHRIVLSICGFAAGLAMAGGALACSGSRPAAGAVVSGPVLAIPDSQTVCVATGPLPSQWVPLRIVALDQNVSVSMLKAATFAKRLSCVVDSGGSAHCILGDQDVTQALREPGLRKAAMTWR